MTGKEKCITLKNLRKKIADMNGVDYKPADCKFEGACRGTCPRCEKELRDLTEAVFRKTGRKAAVVGLSLGIAASLSACTPQDVTPPQTTEAPTLENLSGLVDTTLTEETTTSATLETVCTIDSTMEEPSAVALDGDIEYYEESTETETDSDVPDVEPVIEGGISPETLVDEYVIEMTPAAGVAVYEEGMD